MNRLSKNEIKHIQQLQQKKYRTEQQLFLVEGTKNVLELLQSNFKIKQVLCTDDFFTINNLQLKEKQLAISIATEEELAKIGTFQSNNAAVAVVCMPQYKELPNAQKSWILALDQVKDPGNLGAIVRIADWYGISDIVCSLQSVDFFNPKVIAATMGSFIRVKVHYTDLTHWLSENKVMVFGAVLNGINVHQITFKDYKNGVIVLGSESHGISSEVLPHITQKITIPRFGAAESLNVAMATAIILDNWKQH